MKCQGDKTMSSMGSKLVESHSETLCGSGCPSVTTDSLNALRRWGLDS